MPVFLVWKVYTLGVFLNENNSNFLFASLENWG